MKNVKDTYRLIIAITVIFLLIPLLLKIPFISECTSWFFYNLVQEEYKSAYLGIIGSLAGSWLAITGAIYSQRMLDKERDEKEDEEIRRSKLKDKKIIREICKELLWSELVQNDHALTHNKDEFLDAIIAENKHSFYVSTNFNVSLKNWEFIRGKVFEIDMELAIRLVNLYKYYDFLYKFDGSAFEAKEKSQLDFKQYKDNYSKVTRYLTLPWEM